MKAWLFQDFRQKRKLGEKKCPWSVGWYDPDGKKRSKRVGSKSRAEKLQRRIEGQLAAGTYEGTKRRRWDDFVREYDEKILSGMEPGTRQQVEISLKHFKRIVKPTFVNALKTQTMDDFVAKRRLDRGAKPGSKVAPATINRDLRHLRAALSIAHDWAYLSRIPRFRMVKEPEKLPRYVIPDHFASIYKACDKATRPSGLPYEPAEWWRALITFCYMTGWRISEPLAVPTEDLDLDAGTILTRYDDNKGDRDDRLQLHPVVIEHLKRIKSFEPVVFPWYYNRERLWEEFRAIQQAAGIHLPCRENHEHTDACHVYGFHDLRRAFATENADTLSANALQKLMRHKCYSTTQKYINIAEK